MTISQEKPQPENSFRITLTLPLAKPRIDQVLLVELRGQNRNLELKSISRTQFKNLFKQRKIKIKGQSAIPSSSLAQGTTVVDILGYEELSSAQTNSTQN